MTKNHLAPLWLLGLLLLPACAPGPQSSPSADAEPAARLNVFAAASLTEAFSEIGLEFEASRPGTTVEFNFAGSQKLAQQIDQGAAADVFASANQGQMDAVVRSGQVEASAVRVFAKNRLVVVFPKDNPASLSSLADLAKPGLRIVLAAREVPAGQYSLEFLEKTRQGPATQGTAFPPGYPESVLANVVSYEDNVKIVLAKVALGEADAAIVYASDIYGENASRVSTMEIPEEYNIAAAYPIAPLSGSSNSAGANAFIDFVLSARGQAILAKYGFTPVE